jgi:hypothetical protein
LDKGWFAKAALGETWVAKAVMGPRDWAWWPTTRVT